MEHDGIAVLARELATKMNSVVNIPLVNEEEEQALFEIIVLTVLELIINKLGFVNSIAK